MAFAVGESGVCSPGRAWVANCGAERRATGCGTRAPDNSNDRMSQHHEDLHTAGLESCRAAKGTLGKSRQGNGEGFCPERSIRKGSAPAPGAPEGPPDSPGVSTSKRLPARRGQRRPGRACSQTSPGLFPCRTFPCQRVPGRVCGAYWDGDRDKKQKAKEPERMISERSGRVQFTPRDKRCTGRDQRCAELESKTRRPIPRGKPDGKDARRDHTPRQVDANSAPRPFPILWRSGDKIMTSSKSMQPRQRQTKRQRNQSNHSVQIPNRFPNPSQPSQASLPSRQRAQPNQKWWKTKPQR